jgi:hypothetical protein
MQKRTYQGIERLKTKSFFLVLLPAFFILKNANRFYGAIPGFQSLELFIVYSASILILYFILSRLRLGEKSRIAICCLIASSVYFFYHDYDSFIQSQLWLRPYNRYRWSLPATILLISALIFTILKLKKLPRGAFFFLNTLLLLFCLSEIFPLLYQCIAPQKQLLQIEERTIFNYPKQPPANQPNIYFLVFDEYQGKKGLQKTFHFSNELLEIDLRERDFFLPACARSNYNYTFFSMPSIFNMSYLKGTLQGKDKVQDILNFSAGIGLIKNASTIQFFQNIGYSIVNLSPFTLDESGKRVLQYKSISVEKYIIEDQTFFNLLKDKMGWLINNKTILRYLDPLNYGNQFYNDFIQRSVGESAGNSIKKQFVYAHFILPHSPFLKDAEGRDVNFREFIERSKMGDRNYLNAHYLGYIKYANRFMINTVDTILKKDPHSIILIMSDHGSRGIQSDGDSLQFDIQFYIRTPRHDYSNWPDSVNAVNVFRTVLNTEFEQHLSYLPYRREEFLVPGFMKQ